MIHKCNHHQQPSQPSQPSPKNNQKNNQKSQQIHTPKTDNKTTKRARKNKNNHLQTCLLCRVSEVASAPLSCLSAFPKPCKLHANRIERCRFNGNYQKPRERWKTMTKPRKLAGQHATCLFFRGFRSGVDRSPRFPACLREFPKAVPNACESYQKTTCSKRL